MKVVINKCFGGFNLSQAVYEGLIRRGWQITSFTKDGDDYQNPDAAIVDYGDGPWTGRYNLMDRCKKETRCNPDIIVVIEELGLEAASGRYSKLKIIEIPFNSLDGWEIDEYDGMESVVPIHERWS